MRNGTRTKRAPKDSLKSEMQVPNKHRRKVAYGEGGLSFLKDRNKYRKFYYIDVMQPDGEIRPRVKKSVTHEDMTTCIILAKRAVEESEEWWRKLYSHREQFGVPDLCSPYHEDTIEIKVPAIRLDRILDVIDRYMDSRIKLRSDGSTSGLKSNTRKRYASYISALKDHKYGSLAGKPMRHLTLDGDIEPHYKRYFLSHDPDTVKRYRGFLVSIGEYALDAEVWDKNLFKKLTKIEDQALSNEKRILSLEELDQLWDALNNPNFKREKIRRSMRAAFRLLRLGLRPNEVFATSAADLLPDSQLLIRYSQTVEQPEWDNSTGKNFVWLDDPKTPASAAKVCLPDEYRDDLLSSAKEAESCLVSTFDCVDGKHLQFLSPNLQGNIWLYNNARRMFTELFKFAEVDVTKREDGTPIDCGNDRWLYVFRYTYASELVALGANDIELRSLMRHRDSNTSKSVYAQARENRKDIYRRYSRRVKSVKDYNRVIALMDSDRLSKKSPWS